MASKSTAVAFAVGLGTVALVGAGVALARRKAEQKPGEAPPSQVPPPSGGAVQKLPVVLTQYPVPPLPQVPATIVAPTPVASDDQSIVTSAIQTGDPAKMRAIAAVLRQKGNQAAALSLESYATTVEVASGAAQSGIAMVNQILQGRTNAGAPGVPAGQAQPVPTAPPAAQPLPSAPPAAVPAPPPTPTPVAMPAMPAGLPDFTQLQQAIQQLPAVFTGYPTAPAVPVSSAPATPAGPSWPVTDPIKYAAAIKANNALTGKGPWKESTADKELVKTFQRNEGLTADGLWGADSGIRMGTNYGIVPVKPFYWPKDTKKVPAKKAEWRAAMLALAAKDPMRSAEWTAAANV